MRQSNLEFTPKALKPIPERFAEWITSDQARQRVPGVMVRSYNSTSDPTPREILHGVYWLCIDLDRYWTVAR